VVEQKWKKGLVLALISSHKTKPKDKCSITRQDSSHKRGSKHALPAAPGRVVCHGAQLVAAWGGGAGPTAAAAAAAGDIPAHKRDTAGGDTLFCFVCLANQKGLVLWVSKSMPDLNARASRFGLRTRSPSGGWGERREAPGKSGAADKGAVVLAVREGQHRGAPVQMRYPLGFGTAGRRGGGAKNPARLELQGTRKLGLLVSVFGV
jgi:hypothetical protein